MSRPASSAHDLPMFFAPWHAEVAERAAALAGAWART